MTLLAAAAQQVSAFTPVDWSGITALCGVGVKMIHGQWRLTTRVAVLEALVQQLDKDIHH